MPFFVTDVIVLYNTMSDHAQEYITCYTLVDITKTLTVGNYRPQIDVDADRWNFSRNQQRNWETLLQLISLRAQPIYLEDPIRLDGQDLANFQFDPKYQGQHSVWCVRFASEHPAVFGVDLALLREDTHNVPINTGLTETVNLYPPVFDSHQCPNVYFVAENLNK